MKRQQLMHVKYMCRAVDVQLGRRRASSGFPDCQEGGGASSPPQSQNPRLGSVGLAMALLF